MPKRRHETFNRHQRAIIRKVANEVYEEKFKPLKAPQKNMALALGLSQTSISALLKGAYVPSVQVAEELATLGGFSTLEEMVGKYYMRGRAERGEIPPSSESGSQLPRGTSNLRKCLEFYGRSHWKPWVVAAAEAGYFGDDDPSPTAWQKLLDDLEKKLTPR